MVYVYDTLVNLNEELIDFYDWDENDEYVHIRRVPLYKLSEDDYFNFLTKKVKVSEDILLTVKDKTQVFSNRGVEVISYSFIVSDGKSAVMVEFNEKGNVLRKSKFIINEEMEIVEMVKGLKISDIKYSISSNKIYRSNMIRSEKRIVDNILEELENIKDDKERIDYLYYEWFETKVGDNKYQKLVKDIKSRYTNKHTELLELITLMTIKK